MVLIHGKPVRTEVWSISMRCICYPRITDNKTPEQYLLQYQNSKEFYSRYKAVQEAAKSADKNDAALKTLSAALKDPFFRIRMEALNGLDLSKPNQSKLALAEVEKLAANDPKTMVQGEAIAALAKTKDKKYQSLYEKGITVVSNAA
ncbi:hypothetical protein FQR65_LT18717 [Abscondita terminalis]|nr:hypothetical protein FQR65_LT18717 [Abscondita terminalis]